MAFPIYANHPHIRTACIDDRAPRGRGPQAPSNPRRTSRFQKGFGKNNPNRLPLGAATPGKSCNTLITVLLQSFGTWEI